MPPARSHARIESLLAVAGVRINGATPTDLRVHDPRLYSRILAHGSLGLGEAYMDGWWDADDLDGFLFRLHDAHLDEKVGEHHYDLGNDLFQAMLGKRLVYSCGYWKEANDLDAAQEAKLDLIFRKLNLAPGMRVLDIGCGWGEALKLAAERHGVSGVGVTVSQEQAEYARALCRGLPVEIRLAD